MKLHSGRFFCLNSFVEKMRIVKKTLFYKEFVGSI